MNKLLLLLLILLVTTGSSAQNYHCFTPGSKQYYINSDNYVRGIRIDSIIYEGSDLIYYPFRTARGHYANHAPLDSTGGSWIGGRVVKKQDGTFLFDNHWGDTVIIKTQAATGDEWVFYQNQSTQYYKATVTAIDTMSFLTVLDSVKKITITAYSGQSQNTADPLNGLQILLSKSHGFVQVFDLYLFPYHPQDSIYQQDRDYFLDKSLANAAPNVNNSTFNICDYNFGSVNQQYDRAPGDVYFYSGCLYCQSGSFNPNHFRADTVMQINYVGSDTQYVYNGWQATRHFNVTTFQQYYSLQYHDSALSFCGTFCPEYEDNQLMPEEVGERYIWHYYPVDTTFCTVGPAYMFSHSHMTYPAMYAHFFESGDFYIKYKPGIGMVDAYVLHGGGSPLFSYRQLQYYNKGGNTCGDYLTPQSLDVNDINNPLAVNIYPNPAQDECVINVSSPAKGAEVNILDVSGRVVHRQLLTGSKTNVPLDSFSPGVYFFRLQLDGAVINKKVIITR
ncbi:MAG: T9SS type A sorting domain-containing protein [Flavipsychrobacter sp.]|nr:T9SS type A sorting domain-containing protein [Flavipsychrobacter sp.]